MIKQLTCLVLAGAALAAVPSTAATRIVPLGVIVVPPTQTFSPGVTFTDEGTNAGLYEFTISQDMTLTVSSFTNGSINNTGVFEFSTIGLFSGFLLTAPATTDIPLEVGTISSRTNGSETASLGQYNLNKGTYTIAYTGNVTGQPASVGSSITFAAGTSPGGAVPEPASWALMIGGFGLVGGALRRTRQTVSFAA